MNNLQLVFHIYYEKFGKIGIFKNKKWKRLNWYQMNKLDRSFTYFYKHLLIIRALFKKGKGLTF